MRGDADVLIVGPAALRAAVAEALPRCRSVAVDSLLGGVWTAGQQSFAGVVVAYMPGPRLLSALRAVRRVAPQARVVVAVPPAEEPNARQALDAGADEYVLEPLTRSELEAALQIAPQPPLDDDAPAVPSVEEVVQLSDVLKHLGEGPAATLIRLAALVQSAFDAESVTVQIDDHSAVAGQPGQPVLREPIRRAEVVVGRLALGRRRGGTYAAGDARRLEDYARLIEAVVAQAREQQRWQELAWHDDLSGLHNRRYFETKLDELLAHATAERQRLTVLLFDIDGFKSYNDHYGHDTGDALIREVAALLTRCSREHDVIARYGGDEFAVILWDAEKPRVPGSQHPHDPIALADRFRDAIGKHDFKCLGPDAPGPVTISGGLACFPWDGKTRAEVMRAADDGLLAAKRTGKNRIALANGGSVAPEGNPPSTE